MVTIFKSLGLIEIVAGIILGFIFAKVGNIYCTLRIQPLITSERNSLQSFLDKFTCFFYGRLPGILKSGIAGALTNTSPNDVDHEGFLLAINQANRNPRFDRYRLVFPPASCCHIASPCMLENIAE